MSERAKEFVEDWIKGSPSYRVVAPDGHIVAEMNKLMAYSLKKRLEKETSLKYDVILLT